jgi:hypothetical protein
MTWMTDYFHYRSGLWKIYIQGIDAADDPGHLTYAYRQITMWNSFADKAEAVSSPLLIKDPLSM